MLALLCLTVVGAWAQSYVKVTEAPTNWSGDYLIVFENGLGSVAFNGGLETLDASSNTIDVAINNNAIEASDATNAAKFTIAALDEGYSVKAANGKYIAPNGNSNSLSAKDAATALNISIEEGSVKIEKSGAVLRFNSASNQSRFRFYKSSSYANQEPIQLYKYRAIGTKSFNLTAGESEHGTIVFKVNGEVATTAKENQTVIVEITPEEGWAVGLLKGEWSATWESANAPRRVGNNMDLLKDFELTPVEGKENTYTFLMKSANAEISANYRKLLTHTDISIDDIQALTYTGQALTPAVTVKDGTTTLVKDTHYTLSYEDNVGAGTAKVTIVGIGDYAGQVVKEFTINKADLTVTAPTAKELTYNGTAQTLINAATLQGAGNVEGCQIQYSLDNQTWAAALPQGTNAGSYTVFYKVIGDDNHNDVEAQFINVAIYKAALTTVLLEQTNLVYNQKEQSPVITGVKAGELEVPADVYVVSGNKATVVGNYELTVEPKDDAQNYSGRATAAYSIVPADAQIFVISDIADQTYTGSPLKPAVTVKDGETVLVENTDYTLVYDNNLNVGTATVTATGIGNYTGTQTKEFNVVKADMVITAPTANEGLVYTTQPQALAIAGSVEGGEMLYSLDNEQWATSVPVGTEAQEYTVYYKIVPDANHKAVDDASFKVTIEQATLTAVTLTETNFIYNQKDQTTLVSVVSAGQIIVPNDSYDVSGNTAKTVGTYTVTVKGKGNYKGSVTAQFSIVAADANLFVLTVDPEEFVYDGTAKTPTVTVVDGEATLVENTDYTLEFSANVNAGIATVTATGKGNYTGTQTAQFTINPAELTSVTLTQTEFKYNLYEPVAQTAGIEEVKAGELVVPAAQYEVEGNTQTEPGTYIVTVTGKTNFTGSVTAEFVIKDMVVAGEGTETESGEEVNDIDMTVSVVNRAEKQLSIDKIVEVAPSGEDITVEIPAEINGWSVVSIAENAMSELEHVSDIIMPDTEKAIAIGENAFPGTATIHTTLALLDDYALMPSLKDNYEATKVLTTVAPANKYWTLGTGCDVILPAGVDAYVVKVKNTAEVATEIIPEEMLKRGNVRIIKANNGVLLLGEAGQSYDLFAYSGRIASGMPIATSDNKDYGNKNSLEPVIEKKHYESGHYFVLKDNEFHAILAEGDEVKVPAGKAVLHLGNDQAGSNAQVLKIADSEATGIDSIDNETLTNEKWYDLQGRRVLNAQKGIYIINGKKIVVK